MIIYTMNDIIFKKDHFETKDGKYFTESDSKHFSYWYERISDKKAVVAYNNMGYDYCFACIEGLQDALRILNKCL